jgi:uncharacterized membrane protein
MDQAKGLRLGRVLVLGAAVLLLVDTFAPWQHVSLDRFTYSWNAWHGDKGVLLGSLTVVLVLWAAIRALGVALPARAETAVTLALAVLVFAFAAVKNIHDDYSAWGSYVGVVIAGAIVVGAWQADRQGSLASVDAPLAASVD